MTEEEKLQADNQGTALPAGEQPGAVPEQTAAAAPVNQAPATAPEPPQPVQPGTQPEPGIVQDQPLHYPAGTAEPIQGKEDGDGNFEPSIGYIEVADEVISIVASLAACDVAGVVGMSTGFREGISKFFGKSNLAKGVRIKMEGKTVNLFVYVIVAYGTNIPEVGLKIQKRVKEAVENMTEYEVNYVDVHVEGVERRKKSVLEKSLEEEAEEDQAPAPKL
jgi:uncharacterized alkaline shock family protein YloU